MSPELYGLSATINVSMRGLPIRAQLLIVLVVVLPHAGCWREKPPYSPSEALQLFQVPSGFRVELVAAEPGIEDPVAMAFDERGRLFVVEMSDYPLGRQGGKIKLLEDRDDDGFFESSTLFASGLSFPTGVLPWKEGILVTAAPHVFYLADTNGDNRADLKEIVLTGFAATNPRLRVNGLRYGLDNWIYAAYPKVELPARYVKEFGDLGSEIRFPKYPRARAFGFFGKEMDLRFRPDQMRVEPIAGNSQYGNTFDRWGNRFTVGNNNHVRHVVIQNKYLLRNPYLAVESAMHFSSDHGNAATLYPITKQPEYMHRSESGHFASPCGISVYEGGAFPPPYHGAYFVCDPVHNVIHCDTLLPRGPTFVARRALREREFLASIDSWFRPVFTTLGPDGALYVVDFYRKVIEHPEWIPLEKMREADLHAGNDRGRIYRIVHETLQQASAKPKLHHLERAQLVQNLSHSNMWWRLRSQQLIVERQDKSLIPELQILAGKSPSPYARLHALWTLDGLNALDPDLILFGLEDSHAGVRENAVQLAESLLSDNRISDKLLGMATDPSERVRFQLACTLGLLPKQKSFPVLRELLLRHLNNSWFQIAVLASASENAEEWYKALTSEPAFVANHSRPKQELLRRVTSIMTKRQQARNRRRPHHGSTP